MQPREFFTQVQLRAGIESPHDASRVTSVVLGIFGTLDLGGEMRKAASQLPQEIAPMLLARDASETFSASEFVSSVAAELDLDEAEAEKAATAVLITLRDALTDGEFLDLNAVIPDEFHRFLTAG